MAEISRQTLNFDEVGSLDCVTGCNIDRSLGRVCFLADDSGSMASYDHVRDRLLDTIREQAVDLRFCSATLHPDVRLGMLSQTGWEYVSFPDFLDTQDHDWDHLFLWADANNLTQFMITEETIDSAVEFVTKLAASGKLTWIVPDEERYKKNAALQTIVTSCQERCPTLRVLFYHEDKDTTTLSRPLDEYLSEVKGNGSLTQESEATHRIREDLPIRRIRALHKRCGDHAVLLASHASLFSGVTGAYMNMLRSQFVPDSSEFDVSHIFQSGVMENGCGCDRFTPGQSYGITDAETREALIKLLVAIYGRDYPEKVIAHRRSVESESGLEYRPSNSIILPYLLEAIYEPEAFVSRARDFLQQAQEGKIDTDTARFFGSIFLTYAEFPSMAAFKEKLERFSDSCFQRD